MAKKVVVNADFKPVGEGSADAAFIFNADDERLDKARRAAEARKALEAGKPDPRLAEARDADDDGSVERVERPKGTK